MKAFFGQIRLLLSPFFWVHRASQGERRVLIFWEGIGRIPETIDHLLDDLDPVAGAFKNRRGHRVAW
jgi:hypothetical protein